MIPVTVIKLLDEELSTDGLMVVPAHEILGDESLGPFRCDNCTFANATASRCSHSEIIKRYRGIIAPGKCCDFFNSKNKRK